MTGLVYPFRRRTHFMTNERLINDLFIILKVNFRVLLYLKENVDLNFVCCSAGGILFFPLSHRWFSSADVYVTR